VPTAPAPRVVNRRGRGGAATARRRFLTFACGDELTRIRTQASRTWPSCSASRAEFARSTWAARGSPHGRCGRGARRRGPSRLQAPDREPARAARGSRGVQRPRAGRAAPRGDGGPRRRARPRERPRRTGTQGGLRRGARPVERHPGGAGRHQEGGVRLPGAGGPPRPLGADRPLLHLRARPRVPLEWEI
jgi:hypothetical protein